MEENENTLDQSGKMQEENTDGTATVTETEAEEVKATEAEETKATEEVVEESKQNTFTQEQVNEIVRSRLKKAENNVYKNYGVNSKEELDKMIENSRSYEEMQTKFAEMQGKNLVLEKELAFIKNNINPEKQEDIVAYFKGKEIDFTNDNLAKELATHPEWLNKNEESQKTTIRSMGSDGTFPKEETSEREKIAKIFGLSHI